ncbi:MAG TPA: hypothetical protein VM425_18595 [Myxococcota bacterium]|nr:hypothetical protein [Myxococcota bacterium]
MKRVTALVFAFSVLAPAVVQAGETIPVTIQVVPVKSSSSSGWNEPIRKGISESLLKAGWEVMGSERLVTAREILEEAGIEIDDDAARIALLMGSDMTVVFDGMFDRRDKVVTTLTLSVRAMEAGTGRMLASRVVAVKPGTGANRKISAIEKAIAEVMPSVNALLARNILEKPVGGTHRLVILVNPPKKADFRMVKVLRETCEFVKVPVSTRAVVVLHTHCSMDRDALLEKIEGGIREKLDGAPHKVVSSKHDSIVIEF